MELTLNLIWLAIAIGAFVALTRWVSRQPNTPAARMRKRLVVTTVVCLVAMAFPIISITDDLANDVLLSGPCVKPRSAHDSAHRERIVTAVATVVLSSPQHKFELTSGRLVGVERIIVAAPLVVFSLTARAPPSGLC